MVHELNKAEAEKNREFVNLHKENRKRRFDEMSRFSVPKSGEQMTQNNLSNNIGGSFSNPFANSSNSNSNINSGSPPSLIFNRRKILLPNLITNYISEEELDKIINELTGMSRDEAKEYLKKTISQQISK